MPSVGDNEHNFLTLRIENAFEINDPLLFKQNKMLNGSRYRWMKRWHWFGHHRSIILTSLSHRVVIWKIKCTPVFFGVAKGKQPCQNQRYTSRDVIESTLNGANFAWEVKSINI